MTTFLVALLPSVGVLFIFWIGIKALIEGDRRERLAQARIEAERDAATNAGTAAPNDGQLPGGTAANDRPSPS